MTRLLLFAALAALAGCKPFGGKTPLTEAQFAELRANCGLTNVVLHPTNRTTTRTVNGIPMTVTIEGQTKDGMTIDISQREMSGQVLVCIHGEFSRMGAEATISLN